VGNVNRPPVLNPIGAHTVDEGEPLTITLTASDPDGDDLFFSASNLPTGANFNADNAAFTWTPGYGDAGNYELLFTVTDNGAPMASDSESVTISVGNVNFILHPPQDLRIIER
jgi:hypothetical protein